MATWEAVKIAFTYDDPVTGYNALVLAIKNYQDYKQVPTVKLKYLYMTQDDADVAAKEGRLQGSYTEETSPYAASGASETWFIAIDSTAELNGKIEVVAWGPSISV
ncbi:hypothetical protein [Rhizobium laguerreae]|uniref:hypothetical protein n=1 Tax=Rhizobium laguerreae TaxID=1076926 RepID=UPI001C924ED0|nr:hypothetical protein [Rhizobium laguerreae]MBY3411427.1 hypothetical protein [Rhizobium laguerreae]